MIVARHYNAGLFNQITSFEISYGLSRFLRDKFLLHDVNKKIVGRTNLDKEEIPDFIKIEDNLKLFDVIEFEEHENLILKEEPIQELSLKTFNYAKSYAMHFFNLNPNINEYKDDFSNGRKEINLDQDYIFDGPNLIYYSSFFFNKDKNFDNIISSIKFKKEYYDFANEVVKLIGKFNGCHIRKGDHISVANIDANMFDTGLTKFQNNLPVLISTDEYNNSMFKNKNIILIEDLISQNLKKEFMQLSNPSDIAFGIISNLVMRYSEDFIGTGTSTYTGHIQRDLYKNKNIDFKFFNQENIPLIKNGASKYSWQQSNIAIEYKAVIREWPECKI